VPLKITQTSKLLILNNLIKHGTPSALSISTKTIKTNKHRIKIKRNGSSTIKTTAWETQLTDYFAKDSDCSNTDDPRIIKLQFMQRPYQLQQTIPSVSKAIR